MQKLMLFVLLQVTLVTLIGCQSVPPPPSGTGHLIEPGDALRLGYHLGPARDLAVPSGHAISHVAVLGDQLVVVESPSNLVTAISLGNGDTVWSRIIGSPEPLSAAFICRVDFDQYGIGIVLVISGKWPYTGTPAARGCG